MAVVERLDAKLGGAKSEQFQHEAGDGRSEPVSEVTLKFD
jgi:hypothetical protein